MTSTNVTKDVKPLKKFDDQTAIQEIVDQGKEFSPTQIIGMMIARMHDHYNEEHKNFVRRVHALRDDPIFLTRVCENQLRSKFNPHTGEFEEVKKHPLEA